MEGHGLPKAFKISPGFKNLREGATSAEKLATGQDRQGLKSLREY
jgi:hypothetical protein